MTSQDDLTAQHYTVETEWQATTRVRAHVRRSTDARESPNEPLFDPSALTVALNLDAKPISTSLARTVTGTFVIPYDSLMARRRRDKT